MVWGHRGDASKQGSKAIQKVIKNVTKQGCSCIYLAVGSSLSLSCFPRWAVNFVELHRLPRPSKILRHHLCSGVSMYSWDLLGPAGIGA